MTDGAARSTFWTDVWSFGREILIVVIGVALGLWAQQLVSEAGWRESVASAKQDLQRELRENAEDALTVVETRVCMPLFVRRARALALGEARGLLPKTAGVYPLDTDEAAWQTAAASQALAHFSHRELEEYAFAYRLLRILQDANTPLRDSMAVVRTIDTPRPARDMGVLQAQLEAVSRAQQYHAAQVNAAQELVEHLRDALRIRPSADAVKLAEAARADCLADVAEVNAPLAAAAPPR